MTLLHSVLILILFAGSLQAGDGPKIPLKAVPFDLSNIRILDGPFLKAMELDQKFLLSLENDRLLHTFRLNAGLPSSATPYGGWEAPDVELRGHSIGHFLTACAFMYTSTADVRFKMKADSIVAELGKVQSALQSKGFHEGYLSAFPEEFIDRVETRKPVWAPYYTLHKIMAGLLDMYIHCGNREALAIVSRMAQWVKFRMDRLSTDQQQRMLQTEFGGMSDVLAHLTEVTGEPGYLRLARLFDHQRVFDPLARKEDSLDGLHGNTQFPKMIGAVREYRLTGEQRYIDIARFFWDRVVHHRSYVIGGNTNDESFFPEKLFSKNLGSASTETCNSYNMLKLSHDLFTLDPSAEYMDFYERTLFNHILASQDPSTGMVCYYVPMKPGAFKTFSTPDKSFWCCVGTGMENHAQYGASIYFHDESSLYLNLFIASELQWKEKGLTIRQTTRFPEDDKTTLEFSCAAPTKFRLMIRQPAWVKTGMEVTVNGKRMSYLDDGKRPSYVSIEDTWKNGDVVEVRWPMSLRTESMPDDPHVVAVLYGPIVLAGDLGTEGLTEENRYGPSAPPVRLVKPIAIPAFIGNAASIPARMKRTDGSLRFVTEGLGQPREVEFVPFYALSDRRYSVYWNVFSPEEWKVKQGEQETLESRRSVIERLTVDVVNIDDRDDEKTHGYKGERSGEHWFDGRRGRESRMGWFSYTLKVVPDKSQLLVCTYRGSEGRRRSFEIQLDGVTLTRQSLEIHPGEFFDFEYAIPESMTKGKQEVTVKFVPLPDATAGAVFELRTVNQE